MSNRLRSCAAGFILLLAGCADPVARNADALMTDLHAQGGFSGAAVIMENGEIVYERGFGKADAAMAFTPETSTESGSLAKPVTATAILLLAAEGKIDLDRPAQSYIGEFPFPSITVRQLLSHSAGLPDYDFFEDLITGGAPTDNVSLLKAAAARGLTPAFPPDTAYDYCNLCYDALAAIVARVSGETYGDYIARRLFEPAGMTDTFVRPARLADWPAPRALGYKLRADGTSSNDVFENEGFHGGGNINFSARDLARWMSVWATGAVIPADVRKAAVEPARVAGATSRLSMGSWYCAGSRAQCYYSGHHQGFHAFSYWDSENRIAVAFVSNNTLLSPLQPRLARMLVAIATGKKTPKLVYDEAAESTEADIASLAGAYSLAGGVDFSIAVEDGAAFLLLDGAPRLRLYPVGFRGLYAPGADIYLFADPATNTLMWSSVFLEAPALRR